MASKKSRAKAEARKPGSTSSSTTRAKQTGSKPSKASWKLLDRTTVMAAGLLAPRVTKAVWRVTTGKQPPTNTRHPEVAAREAVAWAVFAGVATELTKVLVRRGSATYWVHSTGQLPPGLKTLKAEDPAPVADGSEASSRSRRKRVKR